MSPELSAALTGLGVLVVFGLIARFQQTRINKLDETKVDKEMCGTNIKNFSKDLKDGTDKFKIIDEKIDAIKEVTSTQATALELIQKDIKYLADDARRRNGDSDA